MKKSIYSLVLMDEVVEAVDRAACALHTSRSNLINQILAEQLSCVTPEMRMQTVFSTVEKRMLEDFRILEQSSAHILALHSPLAYKYKPTVQYSVELYREPRDGDWGRLRVQLRTQSRELLALLEECFRFRILLEQRYLPDGEAIRWTLLPGRLERSIRNPVPGEEERFGELIGTYIRQLDEFIKLYFAGLSDSRSTLVSLEARYVQELRKTDTYI